MFYKIHHHRCDGRIIRRHKTLINDSLIGPITRYPELIGRKTNETAAGWSISVGAVHYVKFVPNDA